MGVIGGYISGYATINAKVVIPTSGADHLIGSGVVSGMCLHSVQSLKHIDLPRLDTFTTL